VATRASKACLQPSIAVETDSGAGGRHPSDDLPYRSPLGARSGGRALRDLGQVAVETTISQRHHHRIWAGGQRLVLCSLSAADPPYARLEKPILPSQTLTTRHRARRTHTTHGTALPAPTAPCESTALNPVGLHLWILDPSWPPARDIPHHLARSNSTVPECAHTPTVAACIPATPVLYSLTPASTRARASLTLRSHLHVKITAAPAKPQNSETRHTSPRQTRPPPLPLHTPRQAPTAFAIRPFAQSARRPRV
jgi:hypothetical protein